MACNPVV